MLKYISPLSHFKWCSSLFVSSFFFLLLHSLFVFVVPYILLQLCRRPVLGFLFCDASLLRAQGNLEVWAHPHIFSDGNFSLKVDGIFPVSYTYSASAHIGKKAIFYSSSLSKSVYFSACTFIIAILLPLFLRRKENEKHAREKATPIFLFFSSHAQLLIHVLVDYSEMP